MILKEECENLLAQRLQATSRWRFSQAAKFPNDEKRNVKAAERLRALAEGIAIPDTVWSALAPYYNESDSRWLTAISDVNRDIGFRRTPHDSAGYLDNLVSKLVKH